MADPLPSTDITAILDVLSALRLALPSVLLIILSANCLTSWFTITMSNIARHGWTAEDEASVATRADAQSTSKDIKADKKRNHEEGPRPGIVLLGFSNLLR